MSTEAIPKQYVYDNGRPFSDPLHEDIQVWMERIAIGKPVIVIVVGDQGEGKTTFAVHIADEANKYVIDTQNKKIIKRLDYRPIDFERQLALGGKEFRQKLDRAFVNKDHVVIYDEAGDYTNIGFATKFNRTMNQVFNMNRAFSSLIIVCLPELDELSKKILRSTRGCFRVLNRQKGYSNFEAYDYSSTRYLVHFMKDRVIEETAYQTQTPEYRGHFKNLPPKRALLLDAYSMSGKREIFHEQEIKSEGLHSTDEIAGLCARSKRWVQGKISENNFVHAKVFKSRKYYTQAVLDTLLDEVKE